MAWAAAEWAEAGMTAHEIMKRLPELEKKTELYFRVDTLEYLQRGGRIGGAAALLGTLLQIKPILDINPSREIDIFDKVRSKGKACQRVFAELNRALSSGLPYRIAVIHIGLPAEGEKIAADLRAKYSNHDIRIFEAGPVIATHVGPGAAGLAFQSLAALTSSICNIET